MDEVEPNTDTEPKPAEPQRLASRPGGPLDRVVHDLLEDLKEGKEKGDDRRQVEDWLRALSDKYPEFEIESGLRDYYLAEADRLRDAFTKTESLQERLALGRSIEGYLEKASEIDRRKE